MHFPAPLLSPAPKGFSGAVSDDPRQKGLGGKFSII
jgi:hypothetical protein